MASGKPRIFSASDASSLRALHQLSESINSVPTRVVKPRKIDPEKSHIYLVKFHEEESDCYITRLPRNLIRLIISYNPLSDFLSLAVSCKPFSKMLYDKYIAYTVAEGHELFGGSSLGFLDLLDLARIQELSSYPRTVKEYVTVRPEFSRIFHIDAQSRQFYSLFDSSIIEGGFIRYNDSLEVIRMRPSIPSVTCTDVYAGTIICGSDTALAISYPTLELRSTQLIDPGATKSVKFMGERRLIAVQRQTNIVIFSTSLISLQKIAFGEGLIQLLYVPDPTKYVLAVTDSYNSIGSYVIRSGKAVQVYKGTFDVGGSISDVIMHRYEADGTKTDSLILLFDNGVVQINRDSYRKYTEIKLKTHTLVAVSHHKVDFFAVNDQSRSFSLVNSLQFPSSVTSPVSTEFWRTKSLLISETRAVWCRKHGETGLFPFSTSPIPLLKGGKMSVFGEFVLLSGALAVKYPIPKKFNCEDIDVNCCVVFDFTGNSFLGERATEIEEMAMKIAEGEYERREKDRKKGMDDRKSGS